MRAEYYVFGDAWTATYGSFVAQGRGRCVWLDERPAHWGGQWALCSVCAHFERQRASTSSEQRASTPCAQTPVP